MAAQRKVAQEDSAVAFFSFLIPDSRGRYLNCSEEVSDLKEMGRKRQTEDRHTEVLRDILF